MTVEHRAHVELHSGLGYYYLWCEEEDCETEFEHYSVVMEAEEAAVNHRG